MAFTGPLACPNCDAEISIRRKSEWRVEGEEGLYRCPNCDHSFLGRNFVDIGALERGYSLIERELRERLSKLDALLAAGDEDEFLRYADARYAVTKDTKESIAEALGAIWSRDSDEYKSEKLRIQSLPDTDGVTGLLHSIGEHPELVESQFPHLWQYFRDRRD